MARNRWTAVAWFVFALSGVAGPVRAGGDLETVARGGYNAHTGRAYYVITQQAEWEELWERIHAGFFPGPPPLPEVDFARRSVIAAFQGTRPTGGYAIEVRRVVRLAARTIVGIREVAPGPECGVTLALTQPFHAVSVPRLGEGSVSFRVASSIARCD